MIVNWTIPELRQSAYVLYNFLCSGQADKVYVDTKGILQVDDRNRLIRMLKPLGDYSRQATDAAAIKTLRRVVNALENGFLDPNHLIIQEQAPSGLFMEDDAHDVALDLDAIKKYASDPNSPLEAKKGPPNKKSISRETFGFNIGNASRFKTWMPCGEHDESKLTYEQKVCSKVTVLTQMILHGKQAYIKICGDKGYANSDNE